MDWSKVVTDPLGLVGFVLALAFGAASQISAAQATARGDSGWLSLPTSWPLRRRGERPGDRVSPRISCSSPPANPLRAPPAQTAPRAGRPVLAIDRIEQHGNTNIAGVQGGTVVVKSDDQAAEEQSKR